MLPRIELEIFIKYLFIYMGSLNDTFIYMYLISSNNRILINLLLVSQAFLK